MDNWTMVKGAPHPNAAYAFMNFILDPANSLQDMQFHGYNTGIIGLEAAAKAANTTFPDMIFFTPAQVATFRAGAVNSAFDRLNDIYLKAKAAAGG
jgi:spermidine/putrescine transport system substrate-binding protein